MKERKNYRQLKLFSIPVLVLYSLFFTVQVFFNFDTILPSGDAGSHRTIFAEKKNQVHQTISWHGNGEKSQHSKIRLNKRFQPASSPVLNPFYITTPVIFIEQPTTTVYPDPFHASPSLLTSALRGPPAVVYHFA